MTALDARRQGQAKGKATQRQQNLQRIGARLRNELAPLTDRVPMDELLPIAARIHITAYDLGYHAAQVAKRRERTLVEAGGQKASPA